MELEGKKIAVTLESAEVWILLPSVGGYVLHSYVTIILSECEALLECLHFCSLCMAYTTCPAPPQGYSESCLLSPKSTFNSALRLENNRLGKVGSQEIIFF